MKSHPERDCYHLIQEIVVLLDPACYYPGCDNSSTAGHHLFKRDRLATAFDLRCVIGTCVEHHTWAHSSPRLFAEWMAAGMERGLYEALERQSREVCRHYDFNATRDWLRAVLGNLKKKP